MLVNGTINRSEILLLFLLVFLTIANRASESEIYKWSDQIGQFEILWSGSPCVDLQINTITLIDKTETIIFQSRTAIAENTGQVIYVTDKLHIENSDYVPR